jgi:hypothetical protein
MTNEMLDQLEALAKEHKHYELVTLSPSQFAAVLECREEKLALASLRKSYKVYAQEILAAVSYYRITVSNRIKNRLKDGESK